MNFKENESIDKLRGGYYTPHGIAKFLVKWVFKNRPKNILEPSCGDGRFITAIMEEYHHKVAVTAVELIEEEAAKSKKICPSESNDFSLKVHNADFLEYFFENKHKKYDAIVGNPPYIRYQYLESHSQDIAKKIFDEFGLPFTKHTNAWVPFVIASVALLKPGGRLAMVVPSEIIHVLHAKSLRKFLLDECDRILLLDPTELLFDDALQGTVLLMIEKSSSIKKKAGMVAITTVLNNNFLNDDPEEIFKNASYVSGGILNNKWMKVLLKEEELFILEKAKAHNDVFLFSDIASVDVGIVTGVNRFFLVTDEVVKKYHLEKYAYPMFGRSQHCPGVIYSEEIHRRNKANDLPTNFLLFDDTPFEELPESIKEYICLGEDEGYHKRYKCRIRKPWYKVPSVYSTEIGMLKRSHHFPKLILNTAGAFTTDTAYRIRITKKDISAERIVFSFVNSLTALSAELEGRHYGGGVLELVPSEIEKLLIPIPKNVDTDILSLDKKIQTSDDPYKILVEQDRKILSGVGLSEEEQNIIHSAWRRIKYRRHRLVDSKK